jgi:hypothetical protein
MVGRHLIAIIGFLAVLLPARAFADSPTAAKDDIIVDTHDDSYDNDSHQETFSYKYKNIGSKTIDVAVTVKAQHSTFYEGKDNPPPFKTQTYKFTLAAGDEHEVSGTWKIDIPAGEGPPDMQYGDDDNPDLLQATYVDKN